MMKTIALIAITSLACLFQAMAQPKPGKEKLVLSLPDTYRWKSTKIPKDTKGIRSTAYTVRGKNAQEAPVQTVTVTTIDRRYYPMKAEGMPQEKWEYEKTDCPDAMLEVVDKKVVEERTAVLYAIKSARLPGGLCGSAVLLTYLVEGPTAFHTVELTIPQTAFTPAVYKQWSDALLQSRVE